MLEMKRLTGTAVASAVASLIALSTPVLACDSKQTENFSRFFSSFSSDKAFAINRTIYPFVTTRYEYRMEDGKQQITERRRKVAKQDDAKYPPLDEYMKSIGLEPKPQEVSEKEAVVELSKPGSSGLLTYHFSLMRGCWYLREIRNHSL
jgi:hypothetical protein